jgi:hypothetical protein
MVKSKTFLIKEDIKYVKNNGIVPNMDGILFEGIEYDVSDLSVGREEVFFRLYDEEGWIGNYWISRVDFDSKMQKIK